MLLNLSNKYITTMNHYFCIQNKYLTFFISKYIPKTYFIAPCKKNSRGNIVPTPLCTSLLKHIAAQELKVGMP